MSVPIPSFVRSWWLGLHGRSRSIASAGFLGAAIVGLLVAVFVADGFRATSYDLNDASVWVTNGDLDMVGRINTQIAKQDSAFEADTTDPQIIQDGRAVFVVDASAKQLRQIAVDKLVVAPEGVPLPDNADAFLAANTLVVTTPSGKTWLGDTDDVGSLGSTEAPPSLRLGASGAVAIGRGGDVVAFSSSNKSKPAEMISVPSGAGKRTTTQLDLASAPVPDQIQVSMVGTTPVALDTVSRQLFIGDADPVDLRKFGDAAQLQLPGDDASQVLVATTEGLVTVPTDGAAPKLSKALQNTGPTRPARIAGCSYSAWSGDPTEFVECSGYAAQTEPLGAVSEPFTFRINRKNVVLNDLQGQVWMFIDGKVKDVSDWTGAKVKTDEPSNDEANPNDRPPPVLPFETENHPPIAKPDEGLGARAGRASLLSVLDNDRDPDGDVLSILPVDPGQLPTGTTVAVINNGQALQIQPSADAPSSFSFPYTIWDGRTTGDCPSCTATVTVKLTPDGKNGAPVQGPQASPLRVEALKTATYNVLGDWRDPDGDPIVLEGATIAASPDTVQTVPDGLLTFTDRGVSTGPKTVQVTVRDVPPPGPSPESVPGKLDVIVEPTGARVEPVARPDYVTTVVGTSIVISPLVNDTDANGDSLSLVGKLLNAEGGVVKNQNGESTGTATPNAQDGTIGFTATAIGSYVFGYEVSDGGAPVPGLIRVDVVANDMNHPPFAGRDLVVLPDLPDSARTVDLLANDVDVDGDVLVVQAVEVPADAPFKVQVLEHRRLRIAATAVVDRPYVLTYTLSDGRSVSDAPGQVVVTSQPLSASSAVPIAAPDKVTVRADDLVTIPVLANDINPSGGELSLLPELAEPLADGQGQAWIAGRTLRFLAPATPSTVTLSYVVADGESGLNKATGQVTVNVLAANDDNAPPVARTVEARVLAGGSVRITIPLAGIDPDGDSVSLSGIGTTAPKLGRLVTPVGVDTITYEAFPGNDVGAGGTDTFTYRVTDRRGLSADGIVRVGVAAPSPTNQKPVAFTDKVSVLPGGTVRVPVLSNDYDPDDDPISLSPEQPAAPQGVTVAVDGSRLVVTAPGSEGPVSPISYRIVDAPGDEALGVLELTVTADAKGAIPIARDDVVRSLPKGSAKVAVEVLANDEDPDGDTAALNVSTPAGLSGVSVDGKKVVVQLTDQTQIVPYTAADEDGSATAVIRVPPKGADDLAPIQKVLDKKLRDLLVATSGTPLTIDLTKFVEDPEGQPIRLTRADYVTARNSDDSNPVIDETTLKFTPRPGYLGSASMTFEVTDGADASSGLTSVISLPIEVRSDVNTPPVWERMPAPELEPKGGDKKIQLAALVKDPDPEDQKNLTFAVVDDKQLPSGVKATLTDRSTLVLSVADDAKEGQGTVRLSVKDGNPEVPVDLQVRVVKSQKPAPSCTSFLVDPAELGKEVTRDIKDYCSNSFPEKDLSVSGAVASGGTGAVSASGTTIKFTPSKVGDTTLTYNVTDELLNVGRGSITVRVRDVPGIPSPPSKVITASRTVTLVWQAPLPNGSDIDHYVLEWTAGGGGSKPCPTTTCTVDGLTNGTEYRFTVKAHNASGDGQKSGESGPETPDQKPEAAASVSLEFVKAPGGQTLAVNWTSPKNEGSKITGYDLRISPAPLSTSATKLDVQTTSTIWEGLENGTSYTVEVVAKNAAGASPPATSNSRTPADIPTQVAKPGAKRVFTPLGDGGVMEVSWTAPKSDGGAPILEYVVSAFNSSGGQVKSVRRGPAEFSYQMDGLGTGEKFAFQVVAVNQAGDSLPSPSSDLVNPGGTPPRILDVTAEVGNDMDHQARLRFTSPASKDDAGKIDSYRIKANGVLLTQQQFTSPPPFVVTGLTNNVPVTLEVAACNSWECQEVFSPVSNSVKPYGLPFAPTGVVLSTSQTGVVFRIDPPAESNGQGIKEIRTEWGNLPPEGGPVSADATCGKQVWVNATVIDAADQPSKNYALPGTASPCPPPTPSPSINASWGNDASQKAGCTGTCNWINYSLQNFPDGTYTVQCLRNGATWFDSGGTTGPYTIVVSGGRFSVAPAPNGTAKSCYYSTGGRGGIQIQVSGVRSQPPI